MLLSDARLQQIADRWEENMPQRATVLKQTQTSAFGGEVTLSYPEPPYTGMEVFPCRLQPAKAGDESVVADEERARVWWTVMLPVRSRVMPTDRLYVTGTDARGTAFSRMLEVVASAGPRTWEAVREVTCWEIIPDTPTVE